MTSAKVVLVVMMTMAWRDQYFADISEWNNQARSGPIYSELGFLNVFVGGVTFDDVDGVFDPVHPDWSGMIGSSTGGLRSAPWLVWQPMIAFALAILGFYLLAEGLRRRR